MKITKLGHACLLVEMPAPVNRTVLFDPGNWSKVNIDSLVYLDDIVVTHEHGDHMDIELIKRLQEKFPHARIKAPDSVTRQLNENEVRTVNEAVEGLVGFVAPHADGGPLFNTPENMGVHYVDKLTHPGDSLQFDKTCPILALPVTAPWGATVDAVKLAIQLKPQYVIPVHDWHWSEEARAMMYDKLEKIFKAEGITFCKVENGKPIVLDG